MTNPRIRQQAPSATSGLSVADAARAQAVIEQLRAATRAATDAAARLAVLEGAAPVVVSEGGELYEFFLYGGA